MILQEGTYLGLVNRKITSAEIHLSVTVHDETASAVRHQHMNPYWSILLKGGYDERGSFNAQLVPGTIIYRPAYYEHVNHLKHGCCLCFNIEISNDFFHQNASIPVPEKPVIYPPGTLIPFYHLLVTFYKNYLTLSSELHDQTRSALTYLSRLETSSKDEVRWVKSLLDILHSDLTANDTLDELSKQVYVHPIHLAKFFKKHTGLTVGAYRRKIRIEKALELLLNTDEPVVSIAHSLGFFDSAHFVRLFSQTYRCSPHQFRRHLKS